MLDSYASLVKIRRQVFEEVARLAYEGGDYKRIDEIPYKLLNGQAKYRESIFLERAIVAERLRLAIGLPVRSADEHAPIYKGIDEAVCTHRFYEPPLVNVIDFACNACPTESYFVTMECQGCLANPCTNVCPKNAISIVNGKSVINQDLCIKCGKCKDACPYKAIVHRERPCAKVCGLDAIESDEGRYLAMLPVFDDPQKMLEDSGELVIVKVGEENGEEYFFEIEDDDEYEFVADTFIERLQDFFEIAEQE